MIVKKTDDQWQEELSPQAYKITRKHGTEQAFSHAYALEKSAGVYHCVCCGAPLFESDTKYDSGSGWPSYFAPVSQEAVSEHDDSSLLRRRTEVRCTDCDAHLGHVFSDGPEPTGLRYCINGAALDLKEKDKK